MSEFLSFVERASDLSATVLIVGASIFFAYKYLPGQMKQQGTTEEVIKNNSVVIQNNNELLRIVTARDAETRDSLDRIERRVDDIGLDVHDIRLEQQNQQNQRRD